MTANEGSRAWRGWVECELNWIGRLPLWEKSWRGLSLCLGVIVTLGTLCVGPLFLT